MMKILTQKMLRAQATVAPPSRRPSGGRPARLRLRGEVCENRVPGRTGDRTLLNSSRAAAAWEARHGGAG